MSTKRGYFKKKRYIPLHTSKEKVQAQIEFMNDLHLGWAYVEATVEYVSPEFLLEDISYSKPFFPEEENAKR